MSGSTRVLLLKHDFKLEYEQQLKDCQLNNSSMSQKNFFLFHQVYTLFLLVINDSDKLIELNEAVFENNKIPFKSKIVEFYLNILNYLYYRELKLEKFMYKTKLYGVIKSVINMNMRYNNCVSKSLFELLQITLIRLKLDSSVNLVNQLLEGSDIDAMFRNIIDKLKKNQGNSNLEVDFALAHIYSNLIRLERIQSESYKTNSNFSVSNFGFNHEIRRLCEHYLKQNSKSEQLWLYYFKLETCLTRWIQTLKLKLSAQFIINQSKIYHIQKYFCSIFSLFLFINKK